jgi:endogenous inhibitor of DNA gyrase (YacG/DUF329 family)
MDTTVLRPCPFCGGKVELRRKSGDYGYTPDRIFIRCDSCKIGFGGDISEWSKLRGHYSIEDEARNQLIDKWNHRNGEN